MIYILYMVKIGIVGGKLYEKNFRPYRKWMDLLDKENIDGDWNGDRTCICCIN